MTVRSRRLDMEPAAAAKRKRDESVDGRPPSLRDESATEIGRPLSHEQFNCPLEFVNRYMETLDILHPNLLNQEALRLKHGGKMYSPLAAQPPGTGKTTLGAHLTSVLRRPRESPKLEKEVSRRLKNAWAWRGMTRSAQETIEAAMKDTRDECLVMRVLRVCFPHHGGTLERLRESEPVVVAMKALPRPDAQLGFDAALGLLIFAHAKGLDIDRTSTHEAFAAAAPLRSSTGAVKALIDERGPLLFVLDDITDLQQPEYAAYFSSVSRATPLHRAMTQLNQSLQRLHGVENCFIYCTGRSLWLAMKALKVPTSPLHVFPLMLAPLTARDVRETLKKTPGHDSARYLKHEICVAQSVRLHLCRQAVRVTGGMGRMLQYLLRALQQAAGERLRAETEADVDAAIEQARLRVSSDLELRITWDGPADDAADVPVLLQGESTKRQLLRLFARALLLDAPFSPDLEIRLGHDTKVCFSDAAVVLGFSYMPVATLPGTVSDHNSDDDTVADGESGSAIVGTGAGFLAVSPPSPQPERLKLVAGEWLCRSLATDPRIAADPALLVTAQLLDTMRNFGGTMNGRPFELLCVDSLCARSLLSPGTALHKLVSPLHVATVRDAVVPQLTVVAMPKVTRGPRRAETPRLTAAEKEQLMLSRGRWTGRLSMHPDDLPWFLTEWLRSGTIALPASAQSGAQDWFLRLGNAVIGHANKAVSPTNGSQCGDLRDELSKAPTLPPPLSYTLGALIWHPSYRVQCPVWRPVDSRAESGAWRIRA